MKFIIGTLVLVFVLLQVRLWTGAGSIAEIVRLENKIEAQKLENTSLDKRNQQLKDEVSDLRNGLDSIEERARSELGLIRGGETFFLIVEDKPVHEQAPGAFEETLVEPALEMPPEPGPESALDFAPEKQQEDLPRPLDLIELQIPLRTSADLAPVNARPAEQQRQQEEPAETFNPYLELFRDDEQAPDPSDQ